MYRDSSFLYIVFFICMEFLHWKIMKLIKKLYVHLYKPSCYNGKENYISEIGGFF